MPQPTKYIRCWTINSHNHIQAHKTAATKKVHMDTHNIYDFYPTRSKPPNPGQQARISSGHHSQPLFFSSVGLCSLEICTCDNTINWGCFFSLLFSSSGSFHAISMIMTRNLDDTMYKSIKSFQLFTSLQPPLCSLYSIKHFATTPMQPVQHLTSSSLYLKGMLPTKHLGSKPIPA